MIFDTHAHYDDKAFDEDREAVLASLAGAGVGRVIDVAASPASIARVRELADTHPFVYGAVGLHPDEIGALSDEVLSEMRGAICDPKIVAVGEIGLDYHWDVEPHDVQIAGFRAQAELAIGAGKPIIVHSRSAAQDTLRVIEGLYGSGRPAEKMARAQALRSLVPDEYIEVPGKEWVLRKEVPPGPGRDLARKGIIHAYAYSTEQARIYTGMGFLLGIGGVVTYKNARKLKKVVAEIPLTSLVLETDCPYLAPEPHREARNDSRYLRHVVRAIAEIKGVTEEEVERVTWENAVGLCEKT